MRLPVVLLLSALSGFLALTQEMIWFRLAGVAFRDEPTVFGYVLGWMLIGLAAGAWLGPLLLERTRWSATALIAASFAASAVVGFVAVALVPRVFVASVDAGQALLHLLVAAVALVNGGAFPLLCHVGARSGADAARKVGWIYFANIIGSTLAPLATGFALFELLGLERLVLVVALGFLAGGLVTVLATSAPRAVVPLLLAGVVLTLLHPWAHARTYERLEHGPAFDTEGHRYRRMVETHSGLITVTASKPWDKIAGGGVYDGLFNTGLEEDKNAVFRAYLAGSLVDKPRRVLVIGLSSGSWARVLANHRDVEKMTIVEINPGYASIIADYPASASLATDPRVELVVDDGRRWLVRHPDARFDLIMMNTTMHWRANATNLLSREFMELARAHLLPGGVLYFNTTLSTDVIHTAGEVFPYRMLLYNFIAASDSPLEVPREVRRERLRRIEEDGRSYFDAPGREQLLEKLLTWFDVPFQPDPGRTVLDDNMMSEVGDRRLLGNWLSLAHKLVFALEGRPEKTPARPRQTGP